MKLHKNLTFWIVLAAVAGCASAQIIGDSAWTNTSTPPLFYAVILLIKTTFLALLKMLVAPIIFFSLIGGLLHIGDASRLKTLGATAIGYYLVTTAIAITIGLAVVFYIHPWEGAVEPISIETATQSDSYIAPKQLISQDSDSLTQVLSNLLSLALTNPFSALADMNILGIATNAFLIGLAMLITLPKDSALTTGIHQLNKVLHKVLAWALFIMPLGIFAIIFDITLKSSGSLIESLLGFCAVVLGATLLHGVIILPLIAWAIAKVNPIDFFRKAGRPLLVALATSSSTATLPVSMQTAEKEFAVSDTVTGFIFPLGATMNMDGTALFEGIAAVFLAYLFGIELSTTAMAAVFIMAMLSSIGAPGMPSGSMAGMQMVLLSAGIPLEAIGILLVVERPLDTFRTAVNVEGDLVGSLVTQQAMNRNMSSSFH